MSDNDKIKAEVADAMQNAGQDVVKKHLAKELGDETAQKILKIIQSSTKENMTEEQILGRLKQEIPEMDNPEAAVGIGIGIGANGAIYLKVTADVLS